MNIHTNKHMYTSLLKLIYLVQVDGWNLVSEGDALRLKKSWKVKTFTKGLEMFKLIADVAEAEGI